MNKEKIIDFQKMIWSYYRKHGRDLPWRDTADPYHILVSEVMLQQTPVSRVLVKYPEFLAAFPTIEKLAGTKLSHVLGVWQGMGYNRRGKALFETAKAITSDHDGVVPKDRETLLALPGIGPSTAGGVLAFAYNKPVVFIETNIRRVFIHHFFPRKKQVEDKEILPLVEKTLDERNPREWYYALFDYGSFLGKRKKANPNTKSRHYSKQSPFEGSRRQLRSHILKTVLTHKKITESELSTLDKVGKRTDEIPSILEDLEQEGFITRQEDGYTMKK